MKGIVAFSSSKTTLYDTDILVVGSGAGAAGLVPGLLGGTRRITIVEKAMKDADFGTGLEERGKRIYRHGGAFPKSREGVIFYRHHGIGGSLEISCANAVRPSAMDIARLGIDIENELDAITNRLGVREFPASHLGKNAALMMAASEKIGRGMLPMPKFIDFGKCTQCAKCELICPHEAKWSSGGLLNMFADRNKIALHDGIEIEKIEMDGSIARAALGTSPEGDVRIEAKTIVLAAGGIGTPVILQNSGFQAGSNFFLDLFVVVYGKSVAFKAGREIPMPAFHASRDETYIVSPYLDLELWFFLYQRNASKWFKGENIDGLMVKIKDEPTGRVNRDQSINKAYTDADKKTMQAGIAVAKNVLVNCGVSENAIVITTPRGAHPGGTAAIGTVVDETLRVQGTQNLYVADASVLPESLGKPPILTIMALANKLGKSLA